MEELKSDDFEKETISRAMDGNAEAGMQALRLCRAGLENNSLSPTLSVYLAARITDLLDGVQPERALCIAKESGPGRPVNPFPEWQQNLAAFAAVLHRRGYSPQIIANAMCDARMKVNYKSLDNREAHRIRATWKQLQGPELEPADLVFLIGPYGEILSDFPPLTN